MNEGLAQLSNQFVYAAMGVYTLAFISFAGSLAATRGRTATPVAATAKQPVAVGAGGAADAVGAADPSVGAADDAAAAGPAAAPAAKGDHGDKSGGVMVGECFKAERFDEPARQARVGHLRREAQGAGQQQLLVPGSHGAGPEPKKRLDATGPLTA